MLNFITATSIDIIKRLTQRNNFQAREMPHDVSEMPSQASEMPFQASEMAFRVFAMAYSAPKPPALFNSLSVLRTLHSYCSLHSHTECPPNICRLDTCLIL